MQEGEVGKDGLDGNEIVIQDQIGGAIRFRETDALDFHSVCYLSLWNQNRYCIL